MWSGVIPGDLHPNKSELNWRVTDPDFGDSLEWAPNCISSMTAVGHLISKDSFLVDRSSVFPSDLGLVRTTNFDMHTCATDAELPSTLHFCKSGMPRKQT